MNFDKENLIISKISDTLVKAATSYRYDQKDAFRSAIEKEVNPHARWVLDTFMENAEIAERNKKPLCDDTGIPHIFIEIGPEGILTYEIINSIKKGIEQGLRSLPGRPMAVKGDIVQRLEQSSGLFNDPAEVLYAPIHIGNMEEKGIKVYILMQGGGPEIRGKTFRIFHQHKISVIIDEVIQWAAEGALKLGCTPCTPAIGIGRSHYEAAALMLEAMAKGNFMIQNEIEKEITSRFNESNIGPLGLGGKTTALASFLKVGPQRASGVRIVSLRLCCGVEPRVASCLL